MISRFLFPAKFVLVIAALGAGGRVTAAAQPHTLQTRHARVEIDGRGFITSLKALESGKEYVPVNHPSPVMSLHETGQPNDQLVHSSAATLRPETKELELKYPNGAVAVVKAEAKDEYFRFQLVSLEPRGKVDNIVWGPVNTTISGKIGDLLGVVRSEDWAIGLYGLDDNTISGPVTDSDCYTMGYFIHSPDPKKYPLPPNLKEGQRLNVGGGGSSDTDYFAHIEEYYHYICGTGAKVEPEFGSSLAYHSRDRRMSHVHFWSLLGGFERFRPRHMVSDPIPGVDFIGSGVALYACPDELGLATIEKIILAEGLPYITDRDGVWVRDPASFRATIHWTGPMDKAIEYTKALGLKDISRNTGEYYPSFVGEFVEGKGYEHVWPGRLVAFSDGKTMHYKEYGELCRKAGLTHGGLHAMSTFLKGGNAHLRPVPSVHLQTICRTKLAKDISETDTEIVVTDPSFLAEKGTWPVGDESNFLRVGGEMLRYKGISEGAPWTLTGVERGFTSKATVHKAGDELVKLQQNVYKGFLPDMPLSLEYADYYASLMVQNGMDTIDFDGFEGLVGTNHGYYAVRVFCRRLFETYHTLSGGKWPRVTSSNVFPGSWEYLNVCNIGGGKLFNPVTGQRGIQGKDLCNGWGNSYFPGTLGKQPWHSEWSLYDAENLEAKSVGWDATYALEVTPDNIDRTGDRDAIFKAFRAWQNARAQKVFTTAQKLKLRDPDFKFHLEQTGPKAFLLHPIQELFFRDINADIANPHESQPLQIDLRLRDSADGCTLTLPDGGQIKSDQKIERGQFVICQGDAAYLADQFRKKIADLTMTRPATLPAGESKISVEFPRKGVRFDLTVWLAGEAEVLKP